jgi:reactive intermediate/imine deaminase
MLKRAIHTDAAPKAIGPYSQAMRCDATVYLAGQIGLDPATMELVSGVEPQIRRVFENLKAVATAAGGGLDDVVRLTVYLTDLGNFTRLNEIMATYFTAPYPARAALGVASLPRGAQVEIDAIMVLESTRTRD